MAVTELEAAPAGPGSCSSKYPSGSGVLGDSKGGAPGPGGVKLPSFSQLSDLPELVFSSMGNFKLKGVSGEVQLFQCGWMEVHGL